MYVDSASTATAAFLYLRYSKTDAIAQRCIIILYQYQHTVMDLVKLKDFPVYPEPVPILNTQSKIMLAVVQNSLCFLSAFTEMYSWNNNSSGACVSHPAELMKRGLCSSTLCTNSLGSKVRISTYRGSTAIM